MQVKIKSFAMEWLEKMGVGLPKSVIQDEVKNKKQQEKVWGTTKAAVLTGDPEAPDLVAFSVYDTKPVHFLSMACKASSGLRKEKRFSIEIQTKMCCKSASGGDWFGCGGCRCFLWTRMFCTILPAFSSGDGQKEHPWPIYV
jgi:hypothetical protein